jgi:Ca2+-binding EF-hand superfamily protein
VMRSFGGFDADGDGTIEFDEFKQLYSHLGACILASRQKTVSPSGASIS